MKKYTVALIVFIFILLNPMDVFPLQQFITSTNSHLRNDTSSNKVCELPFGFDGLGDDILPEEWEGTPDKSSKNDSIISEIIKFYDLINHYNLTKNIIYPNWKIKSFQYIDNGYSSEPRINSNQLTQLGDVRCRLPNVGKYQLYYSTVKKSIEDKNHDSMDLLGNLIFYDSVSNVAQVLNIYFLKYYTASWKTFHLFFKFDKNLKLELYSYKSIAEDYNQFKKISEIQFSNANETLIEEIKLYDDKLSGESVINDSLIATANFPFGFPHLKELPISWINDGIVGNIWTSDLISYYKRLNNPLNDYHFNRKFETVVIVNDYVLPCSGSLSLIDFNIKIIYILPKFNDYSVFYGLLLNPHFEEYNNDYLEIGVLVFDDKLNQPKIVPIYSSSSSETVHTNVLFVIENYETIFISKIITVDNEGWIDAKYELKITDDIKLKTKQTFSYKEYMKNY